MELKGHKSQVVCAAISADNKRAASASKDGTLRVWNINVRYELAEDPKSTLVVGNIPAVLAIKHGGLRGPGLLTCWKAVCMCVCVLAASVMGGVYVTPETTSRCVTCTCLLSCSGLLLAYILNIT